jgi:membrane protease YdiL (CAAX protease family)
MLSGIKNKGLRKDFWNRLHLRRINVTFLPVILLLMPFIVLLATALSLLFGQSTDQFDFSSDYKVINGHWLLGLLCLSTAPILEELGWRGYGVDSLRKYFNLFHTSLLFAFLWAMWHLPLFFVNGYYHHSLWDMSIIYVINFFISILPATFLINWIYYKNERSIVAAILFHFTINISSVIFQTTQFTKCIITLLLFVAAGSILVKNKEFFLERKTQPLGF